MADVSIDVMQRELGVITRTQEGVIARNELQMADALREDGRLRVGPPVTNRDKKRKEEAQWRDNTSMSGTPSLTPSSLQAKWMKRVPHFGLAPVARVAGTVASPQLLPLPSVRNATPPTSSDRGRNVNDSKSTTSEPTTFDMSRNVEMDVFDEMTALGQDTPVTPELPPLAVKLDAFGDVEAAWDEFISAYVQDNVHLVSRTAPLLVRNLVRLCISYGIPFSDIWDDQREAFKEFRP
jgi:hypothetical protein